MKIVVVDKSQLFFDRLVEILDDPLSVFQFRFMDEMSTLLQSIETPDVIIIDSQMLIGSGLGLIQSIKEKFNRSTIILLVHFDFLTSREKLHLAGIDYIVNKSLEFQMIPMILKELSKHEIYQTNSNSDSIRKLIDGSQL